jgi:hypothetical protein
MMTRPELHNLRHRSTYPEAQRAVARDGWSALPSYIARTQTPTDTMGESLVIAIVEAAIRTLPDPYDQFAMFAVPDIEALANWLGRLWAAGTAIAGSSSPEAYLAHVWTDVVYRVAGGHTYEVAPGLAEHLVRTELRGVTTDDLRLPYRSIYIAWPTQPSLRIEVPGQGWHSAVGAYVTESTSLGARCWNFEVYGTGNTNDRFSYTSRNTVISLPEGASLDEVLDAMKPVLINPATWIANFKMIMNSVMYATWPSTEIVEVFDNTAVMRLREKMQRHPEGSTKYERARQEIQGLDPRRRILLGRGHPRWVDDQINTAPQNGNRKQLVRTLVQGHWQRYRIGAGRRETAWRFRQPFWRGPLGQEVGAARHVLV